MEKITTEALRVEYVPKAWFYVAGNEVHFAADKENLDLWRLWRANKVDVFLPKHQFSQVGSRSFTSILPLPNHTAFVNNSDNKTDLVLILETSLMFE